MIPQLALQYGQTHPKHLVDADSSATVTNPERQAGKCEGSPHRTVGMVFAFLGKKRIRGTVYLIKETLALLAALPNGERHVAFQNHKGEWVFAGKRSKTKAIRLVEEEGQRFFEDGAEWVYRSNPVFPYNLQRAPVK